MHLIDGNNVIGQRVGWHRDKTGSRRRLMRELAQLAVAKKMRLAVVFDGAPDPQFPDGAVYRGVKVFYARPGSDADTRIIEMAEDERNKKNLIVVTSDGNLASRVRVCGVRVMRSGEFRRMLEETASAAPDTEGQGVKEDEMDKWMRYFGVDGSEGEDEAG